MHFLSRLFLAAQESFFSFEAAWHAAVGPFSHFFKNKVLAAPASFYSATAALQVGHSPIAAVARNRDRTAARCLIMGFSGSPGGCAVQSTRATSVGRGTNGRGPGGLPLALRLSAGLGLTSMRAMRC